MKEPAGPGRGSKAAEGQFERKVRVCQSRRGADTGVARLASSAPGQGAKGNEMGRGAGQHPRSLPLVHSVQGVVSGVKRHVG